MIYIYIRRSQELVIVPTSILIRQASPLHDSDDTFGDLQTSILIRAQEFYQHGYNTSIINDAIQIVYQQNLTTLRLKYLTFKPAIITPTPALKDIRNQE